MQETIYVYGDRAKEIKEGDLFKAHIRSVEGHTVVELTRV